MATDKSKKVEELLNFLLEKALKAVSAEGFTHPVGVQAYDEFLRESADTIRQELAALRAEVITLERAKNAWRKVALRGEWNDSPPPEQPQEAEGIKRTLVDNSNAPYWILNGPNAGKVVFPSQQPQEEPDGPPRCRYCGRPVSRSGATTYCVVCGITTVE